MLKCRTQVIDGNKIAERIKDEIVKEVLNLNGNKVQNAELRPNLAVILVGENEESELYVNKKLESAKKVGIDTHLYRFYKEDSEEDVIKTIEILNEDEDIDAILVQLPLPDGFDTNKIIKAINPRKDVDCFHPDNQGKKVDKIISPVHGAVLEIMKEADYEIKDKKALVVSNSKIFGENLKKILMDQGANEVAGVLFKDKNLEEEIKKADLLITAVGKPYFINKDMVKEGVGIIDVGIHREGKKVKGDVDPEHMGDKAEFFTPVPGGVGPITVAILLRNTLDLFKLKL